MGFYADLREWRARVGNLYYMGCPLSYLEIGFRVQGKCVAECGVSSGEYSRQGDLAILACSRDFSHT